MSTSMKNRTITLTLILISIIYGALFGSFSSASVADASEITNGHTGSTFSSTPQKSSNTLATASARSNLGITTGNSSTIASQLSRGDCAVSPSEEIALANVRKHLKSNKISEADFNDLARYIKRAPKDSNGHALLGDCYSLAGYLALAEAEHMAALVYAPHPDDMFVAVINKTFKEEGLLAAERKLRVLQDKMPTSPVRLLLHVQLMLARGNDWGASHICDVWQRSQKNTFSLGTARALIHFERKEYPAALAELEKDLSLRADFTPAQSLKGKILAAMHHC